DLRSFDADGLIELVERAIHLSVVGAEPEALYGSRGVVLALVVPKNREALVEVRAVARVAEANRQHDVALGDVWNGDRDVGYTPGGMASSLSWSGFWADQMAWNTSSDTGTLRMPYLPVDSALDSKNREIKGPMWARA